MERVTNALFGSPTPADHTFLAAHVDVVGELRDTMHRLVLVRELISGHEALSATMHGMRVPVWYMYDKMNAQRLKLHDLERSLVRSKESLMAKLAAEADDWVITE